MKIYRLSRTDLASYYMYSGAVVAANSPDEARFVHPDGDPRPNWWNLRGPRLRSWVHPNDVLVEEIGVVNPPNANFPYVILSSYQGFR